jgi:transposase
MARPELVDDGLWELNKPLLPDRTPQRTGRTQSVTDSVHGDRIRAGDWGVVADGPSADRLCYGVSAWRRPREWQRAGVWERLHRGLLRRMSNPHARLSGTMRNAPRPGDASGSSPVASCAVPRAAEHSWP